MVSYQSLLLSTTILNDIAIQQKSVAGIKLAASYYEGSYYIYFHNRHLGTYVCTYICSYGLNEKVEKQAPS